MSRYAALVAQLWNNLPREEARALTEGLYPSTVVGEDTVTTVSRLLSRDLPEMAVRVLRDQLDHTQRALLAREVDARAITGRTAETLG